MNRPNIQIFDTTLRDGTQGEGISFTAEDKLHIADRLDAFGVHYIEGGWPGSNPRDMAFFEKAKQRSYNNAEIVAFGSTCRPENTPNQDANLQALIKAETPVVSIFGKSWTLHVEEALQITRQKNLELISQSVAFLKAQGRTVIYDAEHFFNGYKDNPQYAISTLAAAERAGADVLVLCDTNGGTMPGDITRIIRKVQTETETTLGMHAHNDCGMAVANTIAAVKEGCEHVQGTINGYGERCGNANLCSVIPNLQLKLGYSCVPPSQLQRLTYLSNFVNEVANLTPDSRLPFVGKSAFAHKGGIHVSAVMKDEQTYEHIQPKEIGNKRRVLVSDLSGKSNVRYKTDELNIDLSSGANGEVTKIVTHLKDLENKGYQFEAAEASFELLVKKLTDQWEELFVLEGFRITIENDTAGVNRVEATIRISVNGQSEHSAAEGTGPVNALDRALRKALQKFYPAVAKVELQDYKVRVLDAKEGTQSRVRVLINSSSPDAGASWGTIGASENIINASWEALSDSFSYFLMQEYSSVTHTSQKYVQ